MAIGPSSSPGAGVAPGSWICSSCGMRFSGERVAGAGAAAVLDELAQVLQPRRQPRRGLEIVVGEGAGQIG